ncbi:MAG TPA: hypothetical protein VGE74_06600 [Gemmata sp.]
MGEFDRLTWPHNWYGIWEGTVYTTENLPNIHFAIDPFWEPDDKGGLMAYIAQAPINWVSTPSCRCLLCESKLPQICYQSDGYWVWPRSLSHYLYWHSVVLPERLVEHIRNQDYVPPEQISGPVHLLPWPDSWTEYRRPPG